MKWKKSRRKTGTVARLPLRFPDEEHYRLVEQASAKSGRSMNNWAVKTLADKAREELAVQ